MTMAWEVPQGLMLLQQELPTVAARTTKEAASEPKTWTIATDSSRSRTRVLDAAVREGERRGGGGPGAGDLEKRMKMFCSPEKTLLASFKPCSVRLASSDLLRNSAGCVT